MIGTVLTVDDERLGGEVKSSAGFDLQLDSATDFNEDGGQLVTPDGTVLPYGAADTDAGTVTLVAPGSLVPLDGDWVAPYSSDHEDTERIAEVDTGNGPPLVAVVPHGLRPLLPPGDRVPGRAESVEVWETKAGRMEVRSVLGKSPGLSVGDMLDFTVDEEGHLSARSVVIEPKDDTAVPLTIKDTLDTVGNWTEWQTSGGALRVWVTGFGDVNATAAFGIVDDPTDLFAKASLSSDSLSFGPGGTDFYDIRLYRSGAGVLKLDEQLRAEDGVQTKMIVGAGRTNADDADFDTAPVNGTLAVVRNSTNGDVYFCVRANGAWKAHGPL